MPPGVWRTVNLSSWVKVLGPVLRMCQSRSRIQDTCGETVSNVSILEGLYPVAALILRQFFKETKLARDCISVLKLAEVFYGA